MTPVEEVKSKLDVVEVVAEYVRLNPAGGQSMKGLCPFHGEKSPSFFVHRDKQFWHCFGCNEGGDVIAFYQKIEGLEFPDALSELAAKAGIEIKKEDVKDRTERAALLEVLDDAARFFQAMLKHEAYGARARRYLDSRGITEETLKEFAIGFAPNSWEALSTALTKRGRKPEHIVGAGLALTSDKGKGIYDRFRDRIMIPFRDDRGHVIGFTGRILPDSPEADKTGKYVNSPETKVFQKRNFVFALDLAKSHIKAADFAVLVEGNMDAVSSHQAGVKNVVAVSGTAFSEDQVRILKRHTTRMALAFDADMAGQNAMTRAVGFAWAHDIEMRVVHLPPGFKDPDEVVRKDPMLWRKAIADAQEIVTHAVGQALGDAHPGDLRGATAALERLKPIFLAMEQNPVMRDHWIHVVAEKLQLSDDAVRSRLKEKGQVPSAKFQAKTEVPIIETREEKLAERLLTLMLAEKKLFDIALPKLNVAWMPEGGLRRLAEKLKATYTAGGTSVFEPKGFFASYEAWRRSEPDLPALEPIVMLKERDMAGWSEDQFSDELFACLRELEKSARKRATKEILGALSAAEKRGETARVAELSKQLEELVKPDPN